MACLLGGYVIADGIVFLIVRKTTLDYWRRKEPNQPALYSYVPLANIPMALYFKWKKGRFTGEARIETERTALVYTRHAAGVGEEWVKETE